MKFNVQKLFAYFVFLLALLCIQNPQITLAEGMGNFTATTTDTKCSDYYNLNGMIVNIKPGMTNIIAGAEMPFFGSITNRNKYPVVNGKLYVKVLRTRAVNDNNGPDILDAFVVKDNITLKSGEKMDIDFKWKIPSSAIGGDYKLASYFVSSDKFDLAGLNFTETSVADLSSFTVKGQQDMGVLFKKDGIKVNGQTYYAINYTPTVSAVGPVTVTFPITNTTKTRLAIKTEFNVYRWDNQSPKDKIDTISEMAIIEPGKTVNIPVKVSDDKTSVYYIEALLKYKDSKSILGIRFVRNGKNMPRISLSSVVSYPLVAGQKNKIFSCFYNASNNNLPIDGKIKLEIISKDDANPVLTYEYDGSIPSDMSAVAQDFIPDNTYKDFKVHAILYSGSNIVDEVTIPYVCNQLDPRNCGFGISEILSSPWVKWLLYALGILILIILIIFIIRKFGKRKVSPKMFAFFLLVLFSFSVYQTVRVSALDEQIPNCSSGSGSGSGGGGVLVVNGLSPASTDLCNDKGAALTNRCGPDNKASSTLSGSNLNKITKVSFLTWPVSLKNGTASSVVLELQRLSESWQDTYFIITYASTTPGVFLKCKVKFNFVCVKPVFNNIGNPDHQLTTDRNVFPTISGSGLRNLWTISMAGVSVPYPFAGMAIDGDSAVVFKTPVETAGFKDVGGTSICWDKIVKPLIKAYQYIGKKKKKAGVFIPPFFIRWNKYSNLYNYTGVTTDNAFLYYWVYDSLGEDGAWGAALQNTTASVGYNSTVTTDNGVVLRDNYNVPVGTRLHFNFDNFTNNSRINWNDFGGTGNSHGGKWIADAAYPGSANVCTISNLYATNVTHVDPITGSVTPNVNVYIPLSVNPPNSKLIFGSNDVLDSAIDSASNYPLWGAPPRISNDAASWDCASSTDLFHPTVCAPIAPGSKDIYMYYAPTYGYFYYGWKTNGGTCQTNDVALHSKTTLVVNNDPPPQETGYSTCTPGTFGCDNTFVATDGTNVGCPSDTPYYNSDTNKCYATFDDFANSYHEDLDATDSQGSVISNSTQDYYTPYQLQFRESVYKLNLNIIQSATTSASSTRPMDPIITGPQFLQINTPGVYSMISSSTTNVFAKAKSNSIFGFITDAFKKVFADGSGSGMVRYYLDWNNDGVSGVWTDPIPYGVLATSSYSWATTGDKTFRVYAEDQTSFATSSWVNFNVTIGEAYQTPLDTPLLSGSSCRNGSGTHIKLNWNPVANSTGYQVYKNFEKQGSDLSALTSQWPDDSYSAGDGYNIYAFRIFDPVTTSSTTVVQNWTSSNIPKQWRSVASDSSGTNLVAILQSSDFIYTSTNSGATWTVRYSSTQQTWTSIASSADGSKLVAGTAYNYIYTSTDYGATWTRRLGSGSRYWSSVASNQTGQKLVAVEVYGNIYTSTDYGVTWTNRTTGKIPTKTWMSVTSSADGVKLAAASQGEYIYTSPDSGVNWYVRTNPGIKNWSSITSNSDGTKLAAVLKTTDVYTSVDSGVTWSHNSVTLSASTALNTVASDSTGNKLVASGEGWSNIYTTTDGGSSWTTNSFTSSWTGVASDSTGNKIVAVENYSIYGVATRQPTTITVTATITPDPITSSSSNIVDSSNIVSGGTWCQDQSTTSTSVGIKSGVKFYADPPWANSSTGGKCSFAGKINSVIVASDGSTDTSYSGVQIDFCKIDNNDITSSLVGPDGSGNTTFANQLANVGKRTLSCQMTYDSIDPNTGLPVRSAPATFSMDAKCSRVPDIKEK